MLISGYSVFTHNYRASMPHNFFEQYWYVLVGVLAFAVWVFVVVRKLRKWWAEGSLAPRKLVLYLSIILGFATLLFAGIKASEFSSDSFLAARNFLIGSPEVTSRIGKVSEIQPAILGDYEENTSGDQGKAFMELKVTADHRVSKAEVHLVMSHDQWSVVQASLDGIPLAMK